MAQDSFTVFFRGEPAFKVQLLPDCLIVPYVTDLVNGILEMMDEARRDELSELVSRCKANACSPQDVTQAVDAYKSKARSCSYYNQTAAKACEYVASRLPEAFEDLVEQLCREAYEFVNSDHDRNCQFTEHQHARDFRNSIQELNAMQREFMKERFGTQRRATQPRTWTPEIILEAKNLYSEFRKRIETARRLCTHNPAITAKEAATRDSKGHPKQPKMPVSIVKHLRRQRNERCRMPSDLAYDWTADELNRKHDLFTTAAGVKRILTDRKRAALKLVSADIPLAESSALH